MSRKQDPAQASDLPAELQEFLKQTTNPAYIETYIVDVNGVMRGKRLPVTSIPKVYEEGLCLPASTLLLDIQGQDVEATGLITATGDRDHFCRAVPGSLRPVPWSRRSAGQLFLHAHTPAGQPFPGDPRTVLSSVLDRLKQRRLTPVVATELEFRLFDQEWGDNSIPKPAAGTSLRGWHSQLYGMDELDRLDALLAEIESACQELGLPLDTLIAEQGDGQYEINLEHVSDAMLAADQTILLKRTIKACAQSHGMLASFMAKPYGDSSGNGMHVHVSLIDEQGRNVFNDNGQPAELLTQAVAGLLATMTPATAIFAPHANSYRRFQPGNHAPMATTWGYDNRTTALRIPLAKPVAMRIEHRVSGADANPYLVLAVILAGMEHGMAEAMTPPPESQGDIGPQPERALPDAWGLALTHFEQSDFIAEYLGHDYQRWYSACKRQELETLRRIVPQAEYDLYLCTV